MEPNRSSAIEGPRISGSSAVSLDLDARVAPRVARGGIGDRALTAVVVAALVICGLYVGREIFVPIVLAVLLSFVLAPLVDILERWHFPRAASVPVVVLLAFIAIFALGGLIVREVRGLAESLPLYQQTMQQKIQSLRALTMTGPLDRAAELLQNLDKEISGPQNQPSPSAAGSPSSKTADHVEPIPVLVRSPPQSALENISALISPLLHPLAIVGIVIVFVIFILFQREDLRNRFIKLAGSNDLQSATAAIDDAAGRLSRLFLMQVLLNAGFGVIVAAGLLLIGVPSAILWGILAAIMRFVPYVGPFIAAFFPLTLAIAVDPGWSMLLWSGALILLTELVVGQVFDPLLVGHSSGLSPVAVVVSATFWTALWGPIGLVLATPLTICLVVLGRHVEQLRFLDILLGDRPALLPQELFYQRMLANDPAEAVETAEKFLKERSLAEYYENVALKGLMLAQADLKRDRLSPDRLAEIRDSVAEVIDGLASEFDDALDGHHQPKNASAAEAADLAGAPMPELPFLIREGLPVEWQAEHPVLCVAQRSDLDEAAAMFLAEILSKHGLGARAARKEETSPSGISQLDASGVMLVCISTLDDGSLAHTRHLLRKIRRKMPRARILVCCWGCTNSGMTTDHLKADAVADNLGEAAAYCLSLVDQTDAHDIIHKSVVACSREPGLPIPPKQTDGSAGRRGSPPHTSSRRDRR
ncbi:MAG: AI-2E family transporter [Nitrobacter sp.]|nr:AI-2E family transporter [Nitrobacter sp.]MCV0387127.1 AI-2E family transporter [Nitrobacter sp.]